MKSVTPRHLKDYVCRRLRLGWYFQSPGDGRQQPQIPAHVLLWAQLVGLLLREPSFHAIEALVRSPARPALVVSRRFGDDALAYFTERLDAGPLRGAVVAVLKQAKRNKAFDNSRWVGLALDGTGAARSTPHRCALCHPIKNRRQQVIGHGHHFSLISVVGTGLSLPFDVEPYGPGDSEYAASQRLLERAVESLGRRFADYVVADGEYATAPFLHLASGLGLDVVARLKGNLPLLWADAQARFARVAPTRTFHLGQDYVEVWDADDFDPWEALSWTTVRVLRYRQHKPDGTLYEAYWLTNAPLKKVSSAALYRLAKSRWEIENQGFNDGKNRSGLGHLTHHHANSLLIGWLLTCLALSIERLYRLRYLRRGRHVPHTAMAFLLLLWLSLSPPSPPDSS
jgi:Transposase DDE domain